MINVEKIKKELSKGNPDELVTAFNEIKSYVTGILIEKQGEFEAEASKLQSTVDRINGN